MLLAGSTLCTVSTVLLWGDITRLPSITRAGQSQCLLCSCSWGPVHHRKKEDPIHQAKVQLARTITWFWTQKKQNQYQTEGE